MRSPVHNDRVEKQLVFVGKSGRECQWIVASDANGQRPNVIHRFQRPEPPNRVILDLPKVTDQEVGRRVDLDRQAARPHLSPKRTLKTLKSLEFVRQVTESNRFRDTSVSPDLRTPQVAPQQPPPSSLLFLSGIGSLRCRVHFRQETLDP